MIELTHYNLDTYTKLLVQDWTPLAAAIAQKSQLIKDQIHHTVLNPTTPLTDQQLNDALNGPFQGVLKQHLHAYGTVARFALALTLEKGEILKPDDFNKAVEHRIDKNHLENADFSEIKQCYNTLNQLTQEHLALYETRISEWTNTLVQTMHENDILLTELEIQDLTLNEPISELQARFIDLKVDLPKLKKGDFNFQQYFALKITLAAHSALSRSHNPNTQKDIEQALKPCQAVLKSIGQDEAALLKSQVNALADAIKAFKSP